MFKKLTIEHLFKVGEILASILIASVATYYTIQYKIQDLEKRVTALEADNNDYVKGAKEVEIALTKTTDTLRLLSEVNKGDHAHINELIVLVRDGLNETKGDLKSIRERLMRINP